MPAYLLYFSIGQLYPTVDWFECRVFVRDEHGHQSCLPMLECHAAEKLVKIWIAKNCVGLAVVTSQSIIFDNQDDAVAFHLRFSGEETHLYGHIISLKGDPGPVGPMAPMPSPMPKITPMNTFVAFATSSDGEDNFSYYPDRNKHTHMGIAACCPQDTPPSYSSAYLWMPIPCL